MLTRAQKERLIEIEEKKKIYLYELNKAKKEIEKESQTIMVLYELLLQEINKHNGVVVRKVNHLRDQPTID